MRTTHVSAARRSPSSESGLISVGAVIGIAFAVFVVYLLLAALNGDSDHYGSVPIPSQNAPIELPKGETDIYLAVQGDPEQLGDVIIPEDFTLSITESDGTAVTIDDRGDDSKDTDDGVARLIGSASAPEEGTYLVSASTRAASGTAQLSLTFGLSPVGAVRERFEDVVDELNGPTGIVVLVALGLLLMAPRVSRAMNR